MGRKLGIFWGSGFLNGLKTSLCTCGNTRDRYAHGWLDSALVVFFIELFFDKDYD